MYLRPSQIGSCPSRDLQETCRYFSCFGLEFPRCPCFAIFLVVTLTALLGCASSRDSDQVRLAGVFVPENPSGDIFYYRLNLEAEGRFDLCKIFEPDDGGSFDTSRIRTNCLIGRWEYDGRSRLTLIPSHAELDIPSRGFKMEKMQFTVLVRSSASVRLQIDSGGIWKKLKDHPKKQP